MKKKSKILKILHLSFLGAWADYTIVNKNEFFILPDNFDDLKKAAYLFINPFTALSFIDILRKNKFDSVIHTAGASALGRIFTKLCFRDKLRIINTVRK
jgi:NADPH:quinone reductase